MEEVFVNGKILYNRRRTRKRKIYGGYNTV